jgi:hypothetical protein
MQINSKKSEILSACQGLAWKDFLSVLQTSISKSHQNLNRSISYIDTSYSITAPSSSMMQSAAKQSFRRATLVIISLNRWRKHHSNSLRTVANDVVSYYSTVFEMVQNKFFNHSAIDHVSADVSSILTTQLSHGNAFANTFIRALNVFNALLNDSDMASMKVDVLSSLFRTLYKNDKNKLAFGWVNNAFCCDYETRLEMIKIARSTIDKIVNIISEFRIHSQSKSYIASPSELNLLSLSLKFIHLLSLQNFKGILSYIDINSFQSLFLILDEKPGDNLVEEKNEKGNEPMENGSFVGKKSNPRDRKKAIRRALNSIISLIQELSLSEVCRNKSRNYTMDLLGTNSDLLMTIHQSRVAAALRNQDDIDGLGKLNADNKDGLGSTILNSGKALKDVKKRCQELITKPIEFRSQEGFVVQGDKLLNNYKGIDFTLATWIY